MKCILIGCEKLTRPPKKICSMHCARKARHGSYETVLTDGHSTHPIYRRWKAMRERCNKKYSPAYENYGGRGISVCERWDNSFKNFLEDMGMPPTPKHTLDRIDNDGNYEPNNCRWALRDIQTHNQRGRSKTGYKGVYKFQGKYRATIRRGNTYSYLGTFDNPEVAYKRYLEKEKELYGC